MTAPYVPQIALYRHWLQDTRGLSFDSYDALWRWSVTRPRRVLAEHLGLLRSAVADAAHGRAGRARACRARSGFPARRSTTRGRCFAMSTRRDAAGLPAIVSRNEDGVHARDQSGRELRRQVGRARAASAGTGRAARRPRRGLPAEHPRDDRRVPRQRQHRRGLERLRARHGHGRRARPLPADRAQGADRLRRRQLRRHGARPHAASCTSCARALPSVQHLILHERLHAAACRSPPCSRTSLARDDAADRRRSSRSGCRSTIRCGSSIPAAPPACRSRSCTAMAASSSMALTLHGLHNDIGAATRDNSFGERYHWYSSTGWIMWNCQVGGPARRHDLLHLRRQPGRHARTSPTGARCGASSRDTSVDLLRRRRGVLRQLPEGRRRSADCGDLSACARSARTGSPLAEDVQRWGTEQLAACDDQRRGASRHLVVQHLRRHRFRRRVHRRQSRAAAGAGRDAMPLLGAAVEAWNEQGQPVIDEVGELVCTRAAAVDAAVLLGRRRQRALPLQLLRHVPRRSGGTATGRVASRRLAEGHAGRRLHHLRPQRRDHQPPRPAHGHQRALQRGRGAARGARLHGRRPRIPRPRKLHAAVRRAARRPRARRRAAGEDQRARSRPRCRRASCRTTSSRWPRSRARCRARSRSCRSRSCCSASRSRRWSTRTRWPIPAASTGMWPSRRDYATRNA